MKRVCIGMSMAVVAVSIVFAPTLSRPFKTEFGTTPADFVERLRLDEARRRFSVGGKQCRKCW